MTATPESLLDEVMAAVALLGRDAVVEGYYQDAFAESVRQAVEAYGRACRIEELRDTAECTCVWRDMEKTILHRQCDRCDRIAELEAE